MLCLEIYLIFLVQGIRLSRIIAFKEKFERVVEQDSYDGDSLVVEI